MLQRYRDIMQRRATKASLSKTILILVTRRGENVTVHIMNGLVGIFRGVGVANVARNVNRLAQKRAERSGLRETFFKIDRTRYFIDMCQNARFSVRSKSRTYVYAHIDVGLRSSCYVKESAITNRLSLVLTFQPLIYPT